MLGAVAAKAVATTPKPHTPTTDTNIQPQPQPQPNNKNIPEATFDIDCKQSASSNGGFSLKECTVVQTSGTRDPATGKPSQSVHFISLTGIAPSSSGEARDNTIKDFKLDIFPFGNVHSTYLPISNNTGTVDKSDE